MTAVDEKYKSFDDDELLADTSTFMGAGMVCISIFYTNCLGNNCKHNYVVFILFGIISRNARKGLITV